MSGPHCAPDTAHEQVALLRHWGGVQARVSQQMSTQMRYCQRLEAELLRLSMQVGRRLRQGNLSFRTLTLKARYPDFTTLTRSKTKSSWPRDDWSIFAGARELLHTLDLTKGFRLLGVYLTGLYPFRQLDLLEEERSRLTTVIDELNEKWGRTVIGPARVWEADD